MSYTIQDVRNKANELKTMLDTIKNDNNLSSYDDIFNQGNSAYNIDAVRKLLEKMSMYFLFRVFGSGNCDSPTVLKISGDYEQKIADAIEQNLKKKMCLDKKKSFLTPDRRFIASGQYIPGKHKQGAEIKKIAIAVDCSGSMSSNKIQAIINNCVATVNKKCSAFKNYKTEIHFFVFNTKLAKDRRYLGVVNAQNQIKDLNFDGCEDFTTTAKQFRKYCGDLSLCILLSDYLFDDETQDFKYLDRTQRQFKTLKLDVNNDFN
jgi:hypothetical protein